MKATIPLIFCLISLQLVSCSSYEQFRYITEEFEIPSKTFQADYNRTWQAVLQFMKKYDLAIQNQEAGIIKTRWMDNTLELNFTDSFGSRDSIKSARYKVIVNIVKGYRGDKEMSRVTIFKRQMVEQDFLQGWKVHPSDGIFEKVSLYRIERILEIDKRLRHLEQARTKEAEKLLN